MTLLLTDVKEQNCIYVVCIGIQILIAILSFFDIKDEDTGFGWNICTLEET